MTASSTTSPRSARGRQAYHLLRVRDASASAAPRGTRRAHSSRGSRTVRTTPAAAEAFDGARRRRQDAPLQARAGRATGRPLDPVPAIDDMAATWDEALRLLGGAGTAPMSTERRPGGQRRRGRADPRSPTAGPRSGARPARPTPPRRTSTRPLLPVRAPGTAGEALRTAGLWRAGAGRGSRRRGLVVPVPVRRTRRRARRRAVLRLDGIATVAEVWLNGEHAPLEREHARRSRACRRARSAQAENELVIGVRALGLCSPSAGRGRGGGRVSSSAESPLVPHHPRRADSRLRTRAAPVGPWRPVFLDSGDWSPSTTLRLRHGVEGRGGVRVRAVLRPLGDLRAGRRARARRGAGGQAATAARIVS